MARAITRDVARDLSVGGITALEQEVSKLRQELALLQLANEELERLVMRDTLTPLFNRRHFINSLTDRLNQLERYGTQTALIFIDVNGMKQINDSFGHSAGDHALVHVARLLASKMRPMDIAARVGGDEFALLIDGLDENAATKKVEDIAAMIAQTECRHGDNLLPLSAAVGGTTLIPGDSDFAAIARADMAMYAAKPQSAAPSQA